MANQTARALRKRLTPQEAKLWVKLRDLRPRGFHVRRQAPIGPYIVDFVCLRERLVIEVDGGQHGTSEGQLQDERRDAFLREQGFRVLRFWNSDIDRNLGGAMQLLRLPPTPTGFSRSPLPTRGRDKSSPLRSSRHQ